VIALIRLWYVSRLALVLLAAGCASPPEPAARDAATAPPPAIETPLALLATTAPNATAASATLAPTAAQPQYPMIQRNRARPPEAPGLTPEPLVGSLAEISASIDEMLAKFTDWLKPNMVVLVEVGGEPTVLRAWGYADLEDKQPLSVNSRFRIGSISKSMTAMGVLLLQEAGKLNVQDGVCKYVPACPAAWQPVTIHQLLTHTSGIPDYRALSDYYKWENTPLSIAEVTGHFKDAALDFEPGTNVRYSNSGYVLAAYIIERASAMPYEEYLRQALFEPLGMKNTGMHEPGPDMAAGRESGQPVKEAVTNHSGAGGLYSTAGDLAIWGKALTQDGILPARARDLLLADHVIYAPPPDITWYGYGMAGGNRKGRVAFRHDGQVQGFMADLNIYPDVGVLIITLISETDIDNSVLWESLEGRIFAKAE
jgi:CubicO group peptidase (beta-lactamase class C family)